MNNRVGILTTLLIQATNYPELGLDGQKIALLLAQEIWIKPSDILVNDDA